MCRNIFSVNDRSHGTEINWCERERKSLHLLFRRNTATTIVRKQKKSHTPRNVSSLTHNGKIKIIKGKGN